MRYKILGVTQAADANGTPVPIPGARLRALLTALALRPGRLTAPATLIDEVWPDDPPQDAPAALQALIGRLRRTLGKDTVTSAPGGYRLAATEDDVDLYVFERLLRRATTLRETGDTETAARTLDDALALWRGPALADLPDRTPATRPEALRLEATRARADADLHLGRAHEAVPRLRELAAEHPYDERLHALLIRALRDTGREADALAGYDAIRRTLADGLGTDPGPELRALHTELLHGSTTAPGTAPHRSRVPERSGNLRPRLTSFVGREPELDAIRSELHRARLVTLTGPGGSGKTRLAEEAAAGRPPAWLVELARLDRPEAVPGAVVSALGLRETVLMATDLGIPQDDPVTLLVEYCAPRSELLVLDNCEHVIGAVAALAETLLTHCPGLTILATSRELLGVPGESVRPVEPLLPDHAHRLFQERAAAVRPDAAVTLRGREEEAVAEICRRLDGLPLAIELAAARLRLLTPWQIADRLDDRFRLLTSGSRMALPRQQTLRAVVDWSWDLLDEAERTALRELSVFAGGWELEAAEAVCTGPVADLVGALVDKSLVVAAPSESLREAVDPHGVGARGVGMRYRMLETIHEYATERAAEFPHAREAAERRHRAWVRALVERADPLLRSAEQLPWIGRLESELDNIRGAIGRALAAADESETAALCLAMGWFWWLRNYRHEGAEWIDRVLRLSAGALDPVDACLAEPEPEEDEDEENQGNPRHALRMNLRMLHLFLLSESESARIDIDPRYGVYLRRLRTYFEPGGPRSARMPGLVWPLTAFHLRDVDSFDVRGILGAAVTNCRAHGGDWELGCVLMFRTHMVVDSSGGMAGVDEDLAELKEISLRVGDRWMRAQVCSASGEADMARGRFAVAEEAYREGLRLAYEVGAITEAPFLMARLAEIAYRSGNVDAARAALDEASAEADRYGVTDARSFVNLLRALIALDEGDVVRARELCDVILEDARRGTPPPQFTVMLNMLDASITAAERGPGVALPLMAAVLDLALAARCSEAVVSVVLDGASDLLSRLGDHPRALRNLAAADTLRGPHPRPGPEHARAAHTDTEACRVLGPERHTTERTRGATLTAPDALRELTAAVQEYSAGRAAGRARQPRQVG